MKRDFTLIPNISLIRYGAIWPGKKLRIVRKFLILNLEKFLKFRRNTHPNHGDDLAWEKIKDRGKISYPGILDHIQLTLTHQLNRKLHRKLFVSCT